MRILFDHGTPRGLKRLLPSHAVNEASELGWDTLNNGELLAAAEAAGFRVLITTDQNLPYQQNLAGRKIAVVILTSTRWRMIERMASQIADAVGSSEPGTCVVVNIPRT